MLGRSRRLAFSILLVPFAALLAEAQIPSIVPINPIPSKDLPPQPIPLPGGSSPKALPGVLIADDELSAQRARLQAQLQQLMNLLENRPMPSTVIPAQPPRNTKPILPMTDGRPVDGIREGMNFFRDNDFNSALFAFKSLDVNSLASREDRAFVQYMKACCFRRLNRMNDSVNLFREVADAHDDEFLAECAIWQLTMIRQAQDLQIQIDQLRARLKS